MAIMIICDQGRLAYLQLFPSLTPWCKTPLIYFLIISFNFFSRFSVFSLSPIATFRVSVSFFFGYIIFESFKLNS